MQALVVPTAGRKLRKAVVGLVITVIGGFGLATAPSVTRAHNTAHCYHGDIPNGSWYTAYMNHYGPGGSHYNWYYHYYDGVFVHREDNLCG